MIDAIIELYNEELNYYNKINEVLKKIDNKNYSSFNDISDILVKIEDINKRINTLKDDYIKENNIQEFNKECIIKTDGVEKYTILKNTIDSLIDITAFMKKRQDIIIKDIQNDYCGFKNTKSSKDGINIYNKNMKNME